jgi:hypothetical protein
VRKERRVVQEERQPVPTDQRLVQAAEDGLDVLCTFDAALARASTLEEHAAQQWHFDSLRIQKREPQSPP